MRIDRTWPGTIVASSGIFWFVLDCVSCNCNDDDDDDDGVVASPSISVLVEEESIIVVATNAWCRRGW